MHTVSYDCGRAVRTTAGPATSPESTTHRLADHHTNASVSAARAAQYEEKRTLMMLDAECWDAGMLSAVPAVCVCGVVWCGVVVHFSNNWAKHNIFIKILYSRV